MLKTVAISSNKKTGPIAVTYRAGKNNTYSTCPKTCALHPQASAGAQEIDADYLQAIRKAVPKRGLAWTYSHFAPALLPKPKAGETVINYSADTIADALKAMKLKRPAVYMSPKADAERWPAMHAGVKFLRCPAELSTTFTCQQCGNGRPLCAQGGRDYVIVFVGHGTGALRVGTDQEGGCYAASGPVAIQWHKTSKTGAANDAETLTAFARSLPVGAFLRHHVAGDIGAEK